MTITMTCDLSYWQTDLETTVSQNGLHRSFERLNWQQGLYSLKEERLP
jgi:hypothetical protein